MIQVTFLNVGQGDSILLEYSKNGIKSIGIIDCCKYQNTNPVLDHVIVNQYKSIDFVILSHPHEDHFSGMLELLKHCYSNDILIKNFLHTCAQTPQYIASSRNKIIPDTTLIETLLFLRTLRDEKGTNLTSISSEELNNEFRFGDGISLMFLSPRSQEYDAYAKHENYPWDEEEYGDPNANWLSTLIKIYKDDWFVLLTSDVSKKVLNYYGNKKINLLQDRLVLTQSPHHGSRFNNPKDFWKNFKDKNIPIVISAGRSTYNHPHTETINILNNFKFDVFSTNKTGALATDNSSLDERKKSLDLFSEPFSEDSVSRFNGNKSFMINSEGNIIVNIN